MKIIQIAGNGADLFGLDEDGNLFVRAALSRKWILDIKGPTQIETKSIIQEKYAEFCAKKEQEEVNK